MIVQILGTLRRAVRRQIGGRGDDDAAALAELARGERAVGERAETDRYIGLSPCDVDQPVGKADIDEDMRSEEHTSELQSLMRNSYAVFCLNTKKYNTHI